MSLVAGVDSSTQSCKVVIRDAETGALVRSGRAGHPDGTEVDPEAWWRALQAALTQAGGLDDVAAISVAGQQHGMVCLDTAGRVVRPALLWNDTRSAGAAADLVAELPGALSGAAEIPAGSGAGQNRGAGAEATDLAGGAKAWADAVGSVPVASFTVTKLRWLARHEPEHATATATVCLPHDWLTWRLAGGNGPVYTDRSDASGTGYWSAATGEYRRDLLRVAFGRDDVALPEVLGPTGRAGETPGGVVLGPGAGDNAAAGLGVGAGPGDVVVSIGTSGTVLSVAEQPAADPSGIVAGFADTTGRYLPLVCTLNAARVLDAAATMLGVDHSGLSTLAMSTVPGADGLTLVPYLEGERTPNRPLATGAVHGLTLRTATPAHLARAAVEGILCALADGLDAMLAQGATARRVILVGGGAASEAVRRIAPQVFGCPVVVPPPGEYVADGAARQAAWVALGSQEPPAWETGAIQRYEDDPVGAIREQYAAARDKVVDRRS